MSTFEQYLAWRVALPQPAIELDLGDAGLRDEDLATAEPRLRAALSAMAMLEAGALANPDEGRMVGHYWLRAPELAPDPAIAAAIRASWEQIERFAADFHAGAVAAADGQRFRDVLLVG